MLGPCLRTAKVLAHREEKARDIERDESEGGYERVYFGCWLCCLKQGDASGIPLEGSTLFQSNDISTTTTSTMHRTESDTPRKDGKIR